MTSIAACREQAVEETTVSTLRKWWFWNVRHRVYWRVAQNDGRAHGRGPLLLAVGDSLTDPFIGFTFPGQVWLRHVGREGGYRTVNLGFGGATTAEMAQRVDQFLIDATPEIAVVFAGSVDVERAIDPADTERNLRSIVERLDEHGVGKVALMGPGILNLPSVPDYMPQVTDWISAIDPVQAALRDVAAQHDVLFVDLAQFLLARIARGDDPDFSRVPYRQSRSWHAVVGDGHFNAYGQRLVAEAFLTATADWRPAQPRRSWAHVGRPLPRPGCRAG